MEGRKRRDKKGIGSKGFRFRLGVIGIGRRVNGKKKSMNELETL